MADKPDELTLMQSPLVIFDEAGVELYESAAEAALNMEAIDVEHQLYSGYDSAGWPLSICVVPDPQTRGFWRRFFGIYRERIVVALADAPGTRQEEAANRLRMVLSKSGVGAKELGHKSLSELIALVPRAR
ncbi:MAG TPA: hypothetical protein VGP76_05870 [Planctomycetaceae bacterium]|jgi:hypothetical protein|nr:hypothetical protein [Planctomycetaceae bacterium]